MEEVTNQNPAASASATTAVTPTPPKKSKAGCIVAGALGCLWLLIVAGLVVVVIVYMVQQERTNNDNDDYSYNYNENTEDWNSNYNYNYNTDPYNANIDTAPTTNSDSSELYNNADTTETGELVAEDGTSLGFAADPIDPSLFAYQIGAYSNQHFSDTKWPGLQVTLDYPKVEPMHDAEDVGSLWIGAVLDNDYFIQIGMMSSTEVDAEGHMRWNYFWQMWDDQNNYKYGLQEPMDAYDWDKNLANTFTMTCQNPEEGEWEFWVNDEVVGKVSTGNCAMDIYNSQIFWELTTPRTDKATLPQFGPFTLGQFEYWDSYDWQPVQSGELSYSYGRILDGTVNDQASVCPPYGAEPAGKHSFQAGSSVICAADGSVVWE